MEKIKKLDNNIKRQQKALEQPENLFNIQLDAAEESIAMANF